MPQKQQLKTTTSKTLEEKPTSQTAGKVSNEQNHKDKSALAISSTSPDSKLRQAPLPRSSSTTLNHKKFKKQAKQRSSKSLAGVSCHPKWSSPTRDLCDKSGNDELNIDQTAVMRRKMYDQENQVRNLRNKNFTLQTTVKSLIEGKLKLQAALKRSEEMRHLQEASYEQRIKELTKAYSKLEGKLKLSTEQYAVQTQILQHSINVKA